MANLKQKYIRMGKFAPEDILPHITDEKSELEFNGLRVWMNSDRYRLFKAKGMTCVICGLTGLFFALERQRNLTDKSTPSNRFHFNLYGYDKDGNEIMLTKDHIVPKSKGGKNSIDNYQPMCAVCNEEKDDKTS